VPRTRIVVQGLGSIGTGLARAAALDPAFHLTGAVDVDPAKIGQPLASFAAGVPGAVAPALRDALDRGGGADVLLLATSSRAGAVAPAIEEALARRLHVVSTCEELAWPFEQHPELSRQLDARARQAGRGVVGAGVNPGFVMDQIVVAAAAASHSVRAVRATRAVVPRVRRAQFQAKVGLGLGRADFDGRAAAGTVGHVGLAQSGRLVAAGLGFAVARWDERLEPVQPDPAGPVAGVRQTLVGETADGRVVVELRFEAHTGVARSEDVIDIDGTPPLRLRFDGGVAGEEATAATVLRAARVIAAARPGLLTVLDLPLRPAP
jgi:4-hydroxy-tetrahydrodipicolinate reductase